MKVSIALSGGGVRAMAHLGVIRVLLDHGFEIGALSGASGGALVGLLLSDGKSPEDVLEIMKDVRFKDIAAFSGRGGLFGLKPLEELLNSNLDTKEIEKLPIPFTVVCTDLLKGSASYFGSGPAARLCVASSSLVPIFSPLSYGETLLADGGFMDNMPTRPLSKREYPVIGVNVNPIPRKLPSGIVSATVRVLMLMMKANIERSRELSDFYIEPAGCGSINILDLKKGEMAYNEGVKSAEASIERLKSTLLRKCENDRKS